MAFPTANVTQGSGLTINTLPNAGQSTMANSLGVTMASDQSAFPVTSLSSGAITNPTSTLTRPASAVSASVTFTNASPCVFTWTGNSLANGQTVTLTGTVPTGGNFTVGPTYYVVGLSGNTFQLATTLGGAGLSSTSSGTCTATLKYISPEMIGSATSGTSCVVPSFSIPTTAGGCLIHRVRLWTNATSGWDGATLSVNLWSAAPTYAANGDGQTYNPSGAQNFLANYLVSLSQFADGAAGSGSLTNGNELALRLASGTSVFWDLSVGAGTTVAPNASQTFNLIAELLN